MTTQRQHIHVLDLEGGVLPSGVLDAICAALHKQVHQHLSPVWGIDATVRRVRNVDEVPADGILAVCQTSIDVEGAAGFHTLKGRRPEIVISKTFADSVGMSFSQIASHEVLECLLDPQCNAVVAASNGWQWVRELCDPVEAQGYLIDGIEVSNFVFPAWFESGASGPFDYLEMLTHDHEVAPGGYAQYLQGGRVHQVLGRKAEAILSAREAFGEHSRAARIARQLAAA